MAGKLIEEALVAAINASPLEYDELGGSTFDEWKNDVGELIRAYLSHPAVLEEAAHKMFRSIVTQPLAREQAALILQSIGADKP